MKTVKIALLTAFVVVCGIFAYAQLASAMNNTYYHDLTDGNTTTVYLSYNESNNTYTAQYTTYTSEGMPYGSQQTYSNLSEYSVGQILDNIFDPNSGWYEEV